MQSEMPCKKLYIVVQVYFGIPNLLIGAIVVIPTNQITEKLQKCFKHISRPWEEK